MAACIRVVPLGSNHSVVLVETNAQTVVAVCVCTLSDVAVARCNQFPCSLGLAWLTFAWAPYSAAT